MIDLRHLCVDRISGSEHYVNTCLLHLWPALTGPGACECSVACSTCHVVVEPKFFDKLPEADDEENDMLDLAFGLEDTSRLGCQVKLAPEIDGIRVSFGRTRGWSCALYAVHRALAWGCTISVTHLAAPLCRLCSSFFS